MKKVLFILLSLFAFNATSQISLVSWNIRYMGKTKNAVEIYDMANIVKDYDIIAIQEVVTSVEGEKAIKRLVDTLNYMECCWNYVLSKKTTGSGTEKYAFVYRDNLVDVVGETGLATFLKDDLVREPYVCTFAKDDDTVTVANFHAVPTSKDPEKEIKLLYKLDSAFTDYPLIYLGDFNLSQSDLSFYPIKKDGYAASLIGQKTSLKTVTSNGESLSKEYDNFFYKTSEINPFDSYLIPFYENYSTLKQARYISDHCPIVIVFETF